MMPELLRFDSLPVSAWRNGVGRKADIASGPDWHVGFAWLDADAPFSDFTGNDRTITLVEGAGFVLDFAGHPALQVGERHAPASFDGGWPTQCHLLDGPCLVLNAMTARLGYRHTVAISGAASTQIVPDGAAALFVVVLAGTAWVPDNDLTLQRHDAVRATGPFHLHAAPEARLCTIRIVPV